MKNYNSKLFYIAILIIAIFVTYSFFLRESSTEDILLYGDEDGIIEYLTFFSFLIASFFYYLSYRKNKSIFLLSLSLLMFLACGEEISWGQRIIGYGTPDFINRNNVQHEFNIHNIEVFNGHNWDGTKKNGISRLLEINFLFKLFCLFYISFLPLLSSLFPGVKSFFLKLKIPIPPFVFIYIFPLNWVIMRFVIYNGKEGKQTFFVHEVMEFNAAFLFLFLSFYFLRNSDFIFRPDASLG